MYALQSLSDYAQSLNLVYLSAFLLVYPAPDQGGHRCCTQGAMVAVSMVRAAPRGLLLALVALVSRCSVLGAGGAPAASLLSKVRVSACPWRCRSLEKGWMHATPSCQCPDEKGLGPLQVGQGASGLDAVPLQASFPYGTLSEGQTLPQVFHRTPPHDSHSGTHNHAALRFCGVGAGHTPVLYGHGSAAAHAGRWEPCVVSALLAHCAPTSGLLACLCVCPAKELDAATAWVCRTGTVDSVRRAALEQVQHHQGGRGRLQRCERDLGECDVHILAPAPLQPHDAVGGFASFQMWLCAVVVEISPGGIAWRAPRTLMPVASCTLCASRQSSVCYATLHAVMLVRWGAGLQLSGILRARSDGRLQPGHSSLLLWHIWHVCCRLCLHPFRHQLQRGVHLLKRPLRVHHLPGARASCRCSAGLVVQLLWHYIRQLRNGRHDWSQPRILHLQLRSVRRVDKQHLVLQRAQWHPSLDCANNGDLQVSCKSWPWRWRDLSGCVVTPHHHDRVAPCPQLHGVWSHRRGCLPGGPRSTC